MSTRICAHCKTKLSKKDGIQLCEKDGIYRDLAPYKEENMLLCKACYELRRRRFADFDLRFLLLDQPEEADKTKEADTKTIGCKMMISPEKLRAERERKQFEKNSLAQMPLVQEKLEKNKRKGNYIDAKHTELLCVECENPVGVFDVLNTNLASMCYCKDCVKKFIKPVPFECELGTVIEDHGSKVKVLNKTSTDEELIKRRAVVENGAYIKTCYWNKGKRYIMSTNKKHKKEKYYI